MYIYCEFQCRFNMTFEIEYWYFTGDEEKDFEIEQVEADSFAEAVGIIRLKNIFILGQPRLISQRSLPNK